MNRERKVEIIKHAARYALLCDQIKKNIFEVVEEMFDNILVEWDKLPLDEMRGLGAGVDQGILLIDCDPADTDQQEIVTLNIFTGLPRVDEDQPAMVAAHEICHWLLQHLRSDLMLIGGGETIEEIESGYFSLALIHRSPYAVYGIARRQITATRLTKLAQHFVSFIQSEEDAVRELRQIDETLRDFDEVFTKDLRAMV